MNKISNTLIIPEGSRENFISFGNFGEAEHYRHVPICGGISEMKKSGYKVVFCNHSADEMFFVISGSMYFKYNGQTFIARQGDVAFLPSELAPHIYGDNGKDGLSMCWIHFRQNLSNFPENLNIPREPFCRPSGYIKEIELLLKLLYLQERAGDVSGIDSVFMLIKYLNKEFANIPEEVNQTTEYVKKAFNSVRNNLKKNWSVKELAQIACVSESHFLAMTQNIYNETPYEIIRRMKMENAFSLLLRNDMKIENIARESGYANAFSFSKAFRKIYKCSPGVYRKKK